MSSLLLTSNYAEYFISLINQVMENTSWIIVNAIVFFLLSLYPFLKVYRDNGRLMVMKISSASFLLYISIIVLYCVIDRTDGDYFHLKEEIEWLAAHPDDFSGVEPFYRYIGIKTSFSYSLFRLIIWGSAFVLFYNCLKLLKILSLNSLWLFVIIGLPYFSYPRVSLALCVYLLGFILLFVRNKKTLGILLFVLAYSLHKSIFILLILTPLCVIRMNKVRVTLLLIASICGSYLLDGFITIFVEKVGGKESMYILRYVSSTQTMGIAEIIQSILFWSPSCMLLYAIMTDKLFLTTNKCNNRFLSIIVFILCLSLVVQVSGLGSKFIYTRIREFSILPMCILFSRYFYKRGFGLIFQVCMMLYLCSDLYYMCYRYYLKAIGSGL